MKKRITSTITWYNPNEKLPKGRFSYLVLLYGDDLITDEIIGTYNKDKKVFETILGIELHLKVKLWAYMPDPHKVLNKYKE